MKHIVALLIAFTIALAPAAVAQHGRHRDARELVQHVQDDLQNVKSLGTRNDKERERLDNALKHLSDFDRNLREGKFSKDRLDEAIDDVKNVVERNTLQARDRNRLSRDLRALRDLRADRGRY